MSKRKQAQQAKKRLKAERNIRRRLLIGGGASLLWAGYIFYAVLQRKGLAPAIAFGGVGLAGVWGALLFSYFMVRRSQS